MAEEFLQGEVCWWNSPRNLFGSSPCSLASNNDIGSLGWPTHDHLPIKSVASTASDGITTSILIHKPSQSTLDVVWNDQDLVSSNCNRGRRSEDNYSTSFLLDSASMNYHRPQINKNSFPEEQQQQQQPFINSLSSSSVTTTSTRGHEFPLNSASDSYTYASSLLQNLFDTDNSDQPHDQQSLLDHQREMSGYDDDHLNSSSNGFLHSLPMLKQQPLWNNASFTPSHFLNPSSLITNHKPAAAATHTLAANKQHEQENRLATVVKKASSEPEFKRPRIETPSPLPTFKVRKEKLGDRITALQQLVSPFGKTDTASVLHEAIECIKFLHDKVNTLSTPYLKYASPPTPVQRHQGAEKSKEEEEVKKGLKTRGLCLVPISSTFPVATETSADFWTPTFSGSFR